MDRFLREQVTGKVVDAGSSFTVSPDKAREKLLQSIPKVPLETVYRLLDAALLGLGYNPIECILYRARSEHTPEQFQVKLINFGLEQSQALLEELRYPFGTELAIRRLAQAIFLAVHDNRHATLKFEVNQFGFGKRLKLHSSNLTVPSDFSLEKSGTFTLQLSPVGWTYPPHIYSPSRKILYYLQQPERLLPQESLFHTVRGVFFEGRISAFTPIRSYAQGPPDDRPVDRMHVDLWSGPYTALDPSTAILNRKERGGFLFFRWRPDYGVPTIIHHCLDSPLFFKPQAYRGTFMMLPSDEPARVYFLSDGVVAEPVAVDAPRGMLGLVTWPGFRYDLWGTRPVKDDTYEAAVDWAQTQMRSTADCLATHIDEVIDRVVSTRLLKAGYYADEVIRWMKTHWGK